MQQDLQPGDPKGRIALLRCQPRLQDLRSSTGAGVFFGQQPHLLNIDRVMLRFKRGVMKGRRGATGGDQTERRLSGHLTLCTNVRTWGALLTGKLAITNLVTRIPAHPMLPITASRLTQGSSMEVPSRTFQGLQPRSTFADHVFLQAVHR